jgi:hypothetical protein
MLKVGIKNMVPMNLEQMEKVRQAVTNVVGAEAGQFKGVREGPILRTLTPNDGWILVTCIGRNSLSWLERVVPALKPWPGAQLSLMGGEELPRPAVGTAFIPDASGIRSMAMTIDIIEFVNPGLRTAAWKPINTKAVRGGVLVTFYMDAKSKGYILSKGGRINFHLGTITFAFRGEKAGPPSGGGAAMGAAAALGRKQGGGRTVGIGARVPAPVRIRAKVPTQVGTRASVPSPAGNRTGVPSPSAPSRKSASASLGGPAVRAAGASSPVPVEPKAGPSGLNWRTEAEDSDESVSSMKASLGKPRRLNRKEEKREQADLVKRVAAVRVDGGGGEGDSKRAPPVQAAPVPDATATRMAGGGDGIAGPSPSGPSEERDPHIIN